jgi:hypothetical protein
MGIWGAGLYQSDVATDVRDVYRDCRKLGFAGGDLAAVVLETVGVDSAKGEDGEIAHLALADLLWKDGMLSADLKQTALRLIKNSALPLGFEDEASRDKQRKMLAALAAKLGAPQPAAKAKRTPRFVEQCEFEIGEVLAYPLPQGSWALLRVIAYFTRFRGKSPICEALAWNVAAIPPAAEIARLPFMKRKGIPIPGSARKAETLKSLIDANRLPAGATWRDCEDQYLAPHIPIIRIAERDPHFRKARRLGVTSPSPRPFHSDWWVPRNGWTTWQGLPARLEMYFSEWAVDDE